MIINLTLPKGWNELNQEQLGYLIRLIAKNTKAYNQVVFTSAEDYNSQSFAMIATFAMFAWNDIDVVCPFADGWLIRYGENEFPVDGETIASAIKSLSWIKTVPPYPLRLDRMGGANAIAPEIITDLNFSDWLAAENYWQRYQQSQSDDDLRSLAEILYPGCKSISDDNILILFYWYASAKTVISARFPHFFRQTSGSENQSPLSLDNQRRAVDAQIRALTKGDITKEEQILNMNADRALTELDALAKEYEELNKKYNVKK